MTAQVLLVTDPLTVTPEDRMMVIKRPDANRVVETWQFVFYTDNLLGKIKPQVYTQLDYWTTADEVVTYVRELGPLVIVMTREAYHETFRPLFDAPTVPHVLTAAMGHTRGIGSIGQVEVDEGLFISTGRTGGEGITD